MKQLIETVETLRVRGIGFRSLTEARDTTTAQGRLVFHMFGALAEFERSLIRERTHRPVRSESKRVRNGLAAGGDSHERTCLGNRSIPGGILDGNKPILAPKIA